MKRTLTIAAFIILMALIIAIVGGWLLPTPARALTINGGTPEQRATIMDVLEACELDYRIVDAAQKDVTIDLMSDANFMWDAEAVSYAWGVIEIRQQFTETKLATLAAHEWCHQLFHAMPENYRMLWYDWLWDEHETWDEWHRNPNEHFAEVYRVLLFPGDLMGSAPISTKLDSSHLSDELLREYLGRWQLVLKAPYDDTMWEDVELLEALGHLRSERIMLGYTDNTFRPYAPLLKRHVYLICQRAGLPVPGDWLHDYSPATRGQVDKAIPGLEWLETRWAEGLTRSQLARLLWRESD